MTAEPEDNQWHETPATFPGEVAGTSQLTEVSGRTGQVMDQRWGNSQRDNRFNSDAKDDNIDKDGDNEMSSEDEDGDGDG